MSVTEGTKDGFERHLKAIEKKRRSVSPGGKRARRDEVPAAVSVQEKVGEVVVPPPPLPEGESPKKEDAHGAHKRDDRPPEWICVNCKTNNYPDRVQCRHCRTPREGGVAPAPRGGGRRSRERRRRSRSRSRSRDRRRRFFFFCVVFLCCFQFLNSF